MTLTELIADRPMRKSYWEPGWRRISQEEVLERENRRRVLRAQLRDLYGEAVETAAPLHDLFRPLDGPYPFLSAEAQQALVILQLERQVARAQCASTGASAARFATPSMRPVPMDQCVDVGDEKLVARLAQFLSPTQAFEVALRESAAADRLRASNVLLSENEFRAAYQIIAGATASHVSVSLGALSAAVTPEKAVAILGVTDPLYAALQSAGRQLGLSERQIEDAYVVVLETNDSIAKELTPGRTGLRQSPAVARIFADRDRRLREVVGDQTATAFSQVLARAMPRATPTAPSAN